MTLFQRHCSDETLICHLDGELPFYAKTPVRRHLERCWQCRLRLSEIESQVMAATRAMENDAFPGPQRIAEAQSRFLSRADRIAQEVFQARPQPAWPVGRRGLAWAAAGLLLAAVLPMWRLVRSDPRSAAVETMKRVELAEAQAARIPSHQRFRVVARQARPVVVSRESRLELWAEPARGRFTSRVSDTNGALRHAVWQPEPDRQYVYRAKGSATVVRISRQQAQESWDLLRDGMNLEELEAGLLTWLENRPWRPVSISKAMGELASTDGASLAAEETRSNGQAVVRLRARKTAGAVTVEFVLDLDRRTFTPQLQSIRYESPARSLELQLYTEPVPATMPASFEPPASSAPPPPPAAVSRAPGSVPEAALPPVADAAMAEARIYHALHGIRSCLGETIQVETRGDGHFEVRGVVARPERKEQLVAALAPLADSRLTLKLQSAQEMLRDLRPESISAGEQPASPGANRRGQALKWLAGFFNGREPEAEEFADRVLSSGEEFMRDAQALRQLAERFGGRSEFVSGQAHQMVRDMAADHLKDLAARVESTRQLMTPVLGAMAPAGDAATGGARQWDEELLHIYQLAKRWNERLRNLLTGGDTSRSHEQMAREIAEDFGMLRAGIAGASGHAR